MKIQYLNGGLGNQAFQYIFAKFVELETGEKCYLDNSFFFNPPFDHNGYELKKIFNIEANLLSNYFTPDVWSYMMDIYIKENIKICQQILNNDIDIFMVAETNNHNFQGNLVYVPANQYTPTIAYTQGNVYYHGYWINKNWFDKYKDIMLKEFTFPSLTNEDHIKILDKIVKELSVAVHIRRGDFVKLNWKLPTEYYFNAMKQMSKRFPNASYFIFSDDIAWCKHNYLELGLQFAKNNIHFITGNIKGNNYIDLQLMSNSKAMIMSNSSFNYLAVLLNKNRPNFFVINPTTREV